MLTRQGWLVGLGAAALLLMGRVLGLVELFALGLVAAALLVGVRHPRRIAPASSSRSAEPCTRPACTSAPRAASTSPSATCGPPAPPCCACATRCRAPAAPTCSCRRSAAASGPWPPTASPPSGAASCRSVRSRSWWATRSASPTSPPSRRRWWRSRCSPTSTRSTRCPTRRGTTPSPAPASRTRSAAPGEDFYALRPYVVGDDLRRIHWPSSARHDELLVRQDELPWQGRTTVLLDVRKAAHSGDSLEVAVSAAASIVAATARRHDLIRLVTTAGSDSDFAPGSDHVEAIMEHLAVVPAVPGRQPAPVDRDARPPLHRRGPRRDRGRGAGGGPARRRPPAQPLRLAHDRAHRPLGVGSRRADRATARGPRAAGRRATTPFAAGVERPRPHWRRGAAAPRWEPADERRAAPLVLAAEVGLLAVTLAAVLGHEPAVRRRRLARADGRQRASPPTSSPPRCAAAASSLPVAGVADGGRRPPSWPPGPRYWSTTVGGHPHRRHLVGDAGRPRRGVGAVPGRGGARRRSRPASCWPAASPCGWWPTSADWAAFRLWVPFEATLPAGTLFLFTAAARHRRAGRGWAVGAVRRRAARLPARCTAWPARTAAATGWPTDGSAGHRSLLHRRQRPRGGGRGVPAR